jgi:hypothetical protein
VNVDTAVVVPKQHGHHDVRKVLPTHPRPRSGTDDAAVLVDEGYQLFT